MHRESRFGRPALIRFARRKREIALLTVGEARAALRRLWFGMRSRMLAALVLTALFTLATAALTLLAPLESALKNDSRRIGEGTVTVDRARLANLPVRRDGEPVADALGDELELFAHENGATYVVWDDHLNRIEDTDRADTRPQDKIAPAVVRKALHPPPGVTTPYTLASDVLVVTIRYQGQPFGIADGRYFVLEMIQRVDAVTIADSVVRTAFLYAALVGFGVAILLGIALSSRLLRRLRLLRDASRSLDEHELSALDVRHDEVPDEIGELARSFKTMRERLRQQEQARRVFVATASHELRTPLTSLEGTLELLDEDLEYESVDLFDARQRVASARRQARRLSSLAKDLLDLSRIDAQLDLRSEPVELGEIARAVAAEFDMHAEERNVVLELDDVGGPSWAQADPGSVARVVRILLDNALRFAPARSTITIRIGVVGDRPAIEVADEGVGVPPDERELIFERFQRGRNSGEEGGFGLGLAIGSELAARMGGRLELTEHSPGAAFRVSLPPLTSDVPEPAQSDSGIP
jgi:signal transduction histidine kinase